MKYCRKYGRKLSFQDVKAHDCFNEAGQKKGFPQNKKCKFMEVY